MPNGPDIEYGAAPTAQTAGLDPNNPNAETTYIVNYQLPSGRWTSISRRLTQSGSYNRTADDYTFDVDALRASAFPAVSVTADLTLTDDYFTALGIPSSAAITITLPLAATYPGRVFVVKNLSSFYVVIACTSTDYVEGAATLTLIQGASVMLQSIEANWWAIVHNIRGPENILTDANGDVLSDSNGDVLTES